MWRGAQRRQAGVGKVVKRVWSLLGLAYISAPHLLTRTVFAVLVPSGDAWEVHQVPGTGASTMGTWYRASFWEDTGSRGQHHHLPLRDLGQIRPGLGHRLITCSHAALSRPMRDCVGENTGQG